MQKLAFQINSTSSYCCSNFEELLTKANSVTIHHKNLQLLATEIFKTQRNLNPSFTNQIFMEKDTPYILRSGRNISAPKPNTTGYGVENARFLGTKIWHTMPSSLKESRTLNNFKRDIKKYKFECNCRLCKLFEGVVAPWCNPLTLQPE